MPVNFASAKSHTKRQGAWSTTGKAAQVFFAQFDTLVPVGYLGHSRFFPVRRCRVRLLQYLASLVQTVFLNHNKEYLRHAAIFF
jgi:hypothetical protein